MNRLAFAVLLCLLAWPALAGSDQQPASPQQEWNILGKQLGQAYRDFDGKRRIARTEEEQRKALVEYNAATRPLAVRCLALAEKYPTKPIALDALNRVLTLHGCQQERAKAAALVVRDHIASDRLGPICSRVRFNFDRDTEMLLRAVLAKNPHKEIKAEAALGLAFCLHYRTGFARRIKANPQLAQTFAASAGKEVVEELRQVDVAELESATEKAWREFADKYSADMPLNKLTTACQFLGGRAAKAVEPALRILERDQRREIRAVACLKLGQVLKRRADETAEHDLKAAARLREDSAEALTRAAEQYGDVNLASGPRKIPVGAKAKSELYELRHLSLGVQAPEIVGEDQDGKKFKLSDYRGKVILLDFWSEG